MWWKHTKFTTAVVFLTLAFLLLTPVGLITNRLELSRETFNEILDCYEDLAEDIYTK